MVAYLIRHGRTVSNEKLLYCGVTDVSLSEGGKADLFKLKEEYDYSAAMGHDTYTSGLLRTEETLEILLGSVPHTAACGLKEMDFGIFENKSYDELKDVPEFLDWIDDRTSFVCPGGESNDQMTERSIKAFREITERGRDFLAVFHGGPIGAVMNDLFPVNGKNWRDWQPKNGRGYKIYFSDGKPLFFEDYPLPKHN